MRTRRPTSEGDALESQRGALTAAMDRYADGDTAPFRTVYDLLAPRRTAFFSRGTHDTGRAEDLVQQTLLQMHRARQTFVRGSDVCPWAYAIGRRLLIDAHRRNKNEVPVDSATDEVPIRESEASFDGCP